MILYKKEQDKVYKYAVMAYSFLDYCNIFYYMINDSNLNII